MYMIGFCKLAHVFVCDAASDPQIATSVAPASKELGVSRTGDFDVWAKRAWSRRKALPRPRTVALVHFDDLKFSQVSSSIPLIVREIRTFYLSVSLFSADLRW